MPRPGIHPLMHRVTVVLRNGASIEVMSAVPRAAPYFLRQVRRNAMHVWFTASPVITCEQNSPGDFLSQERRSMLQMQPLQPNTSLYRRKQFCRQDKR